MNKVWFTRGWAAVALYPVTVLYGVLVFVRRSLYKSGILKSSSSGVPVIVVGNISVGGTGKTPIVSMLVKKLENAGYKPGIVSRGYGAVPAKEPRLINADSQVEWAGDEPLMLSRDTGVPVCICIARAAAVDYLVNEANVDVIVSDDGLQHYAMKRDMEIAVVDGQRLLGNGWLLPAGPLREPPARLNAVEIIAMQQRPDDAETDRLKRLESLPVLRETLLRAGSFHLAIDSLINLKTNQVKKLESFKNSRAHAVAGVGNPQRFFESLTRQSVELIKHAKPDHHKFLPEDVDFNDNLPVLMTSKDAVKVRELDVDMSNLYEVSVSAVLDEALESAFDRVLTTLNS